MEVESAVARAKAPFQAELNAASERATTAESRAASNANIALTEARQRASAAEARAMSANVTLSETHSSHDTIKQQVSDERQRVPTY